MTDLQLNLAGVELRSLNRDLRGISRQAMFGRSSRAKKQRDLACLACRGAFGKAPPLPLRITITRVGPRELDGDNLQGACKHARDGIADWLGANDRDKRIQWVYDQAKGSLKEYGVNIRVQTWVQTFDEVLICDKVYQELVKKSLKLSEARAKLEPGTSRARVTTANARWARAAEARDLRFNQLRAGWEAGQ